MIKQFAQQNLIRAKLLKPDDRLISSLKKRAGESKSSFKYDSIKSYPHGLKNIYNVMYNNDEDILSMEDGDISQIKTTCVVYPPGCTDAVEVNGINDSVALYSYGGSDVVTAEPNMEIMGMAGMKMPKDSKMNKREILFREEGSYFIDEFPLSIVSNYVIQSRTNKRFVVPQTKGGRSRNIALSSNKWMFVFTRLCGEHTIKKIIKSVTGEEFDSGKLGSKANDILKKLLKETDVGSMIKTLTDSMSKPSRKMKHSPEDEAEVMEAFNNIE